MQLFLDLKNPTMTADIPVDNIVKNHLEVIALSMIIDKPMCGYELIKEIFLKYNVLVSQGTLYSLLYSLRDEGILQVESMKGDMKTKRYYVNQDETHTIENKIEEFIRAEESILDSLRKMDSYVLL